MALNFLCIVSSIREGRMAERMIALLRNKFNEVLAPKGHTLEVLDPAEYDLPVLKKPLHFHSDWSEAPDYLHKINKLVSGADAYIILTAEYNRSLPPALTNLMDHIPPTSYEFKASAIVSYSLSTQGGVFAVAAARPYLCELGCLPIKHFTAVSTVSQTVKEDGTTDNPHVESSVTKLFNELDWWARAAKSLRDTEGKPNQK